MITYDQRKKNILLDSARDQTWFVDCKKVM